MKERMIALLRDWGAGLENALYEEAVSYLCGRTEFPEEEVEIRVEGRRVGTQKTRLIAPAVALRCSAVEPDAYPALRQHLHRFLDHTPLRAIQWINVTPRHVHFAIIRRSEVKYGR